MRLTVVQNATAGAMLAVLAFLLVFPAIPVRAASSSQPIFQTTLLAPTSNPIRRQYSAIIAQQFESVGIGVNLVYVSFSVLIGRLFPASCPCGQSYDQGGFDMAFIGHGGGAPLPDFRLLTEYHSEVGVPVNNYPLYKNTTVDSLIDKYQTDFNTTDRIATGQQIIRMVSQDRPVLTIYYLADQYIFANYLKPWGQQASYTTSELPDVDHWQTDATHTAANVAVTGDLDSVNYLVSSASNTIYDKWIYGELQDALQYLQPISLTYPDPGTGITEEATSITSNAAHTNYTVAFRNLSWSDGQPVTADDYLYWMEASLNAVGTSVNLGEYQSVLGLGTSFKWLNGTTTYTFNGTYYGTLAAVPGGASAITSAYVAVNKNTFSFTVPVAYIFTDPIMTGIGALPKHILEQYPEGQWDTLMGSISNNTPVTVTWAANPSEGVTAGSTSTYNYIVSDGPYLWKGYDPITQTATLTLNTNYWNYSASNPNGYYKIQTLHVVHIVDKAAALSAFATGQVNALDTNYQFTSVDKANAQSNNGYMTVNAGPGAGSQEMGFNMMNPIFGTGTQTPVGQSDPTKAAWAAKQVRNALSDLIPRQLIINNLLLGAGVPGITGMAISFATLYPPDVTADPYSPSQAVSLLAAAGYGNAGGGQIGSPTGTPIQTISVSNITVSVPTYLVGQAFTFQGSFTVNAAAGAAGNGFAAILMSSTDNSTWTPVALIQTTGGGGYSYTQAFASAGAQSYKVFNTGIPWSYVIANGFGSASALFADWQVTSSHGQFLNTTDSAYSPQLNFRVGTLAQVISQLATGIGGDFSALSTGIAGQLSGVQSNLVAQLGTLTSAVNNLNTKVGTLATQSDLNNTNSQLTTISYVAYAAIAIALILGLVAIFLAMRKKS